MNQKLLAVLGLSLTLAPFAAQAHGRHWHHDRDWDDDDDVQVRVAPPPAQPGGHYEWRAVNRWIPAHGESFFVSGGCAVRPGFVRVVVCAPGHYAQRWVPGHYEQGGQWVWVANPQYQPVPVYPQYPDQQQYQDPQYPDQDAPEYPDADTTYPEQTAPSSYELHADPNGVSVGVQVAADRR